MNSLPNADSLEIDCRAVAARLQCERDFLLLDCRERDEHNLVRIERGRLLPMSELQGRVAELEEFRESEIVVYCHHGVRSRQVALWLSTQGFADVKSMCGGIDRWAVEIDASLPRY